MITNSSSEVFSVKSKRPAEEIKELIRHVKLLCKHILRK